MKNEQLYKKTCDILFDAYFDNDLKHGDCYACAVGNMIVGNNGYKIQAEHGCIYWIKNRKIIPSEWSNVFCTSGGVFHCQEIEERAFTGAAKTQCLSTGYKWQDLAKIEYAFETADKGASDEDYMFNGLVAVLEVLKIIHEVKEDNQITRFKNHYLSKQLI